MRKHTGILPVRMLGRERSADDSCAVLSRVMVCAPAMLSHVQTRAASAHAQRFSPVRYVCYLFLFFSFLFFSFFLILFSFPFLFPSARCCLVFFFVSFFLVFFLFFILFFFSFLFLFPFYNFNLFLFFVLCYFYIIF
jgi:hypothetical protein